MRTLRFSLTGMLLALSLLVPFDEAMAQRDDNRRAPATAGALALPLTGTVVNAANQSIGQFSGVVTINRFARENRQLVAVAIVRGTVFSPTGQVLRSGLQTVVLPVTLSNVSAVKLDAPASAEPRIVLASFASTRRAGIALPPAQTCGILHLDIGGNAVNLLGFTVNLSPVTLDISGDSAGPLGALVCQILALLGTVADVVGLLNSLLGLLTGLLGGLTGGLGGLAG